MNKNLIYLISGIGPLRLFASCLDRMFWALSRVWSHLRFKALVRKSGRSVCHWSVELKYPERLEIGEGVSIGPNSSLGAMGGIVIHDFVRVSRGVVVETAGLDVTVDVPYPHVSKPIVIERGAWIAANAMILGGVTIGEYAVIGAGAVITKNVPPRAVVVGGRNRTIKNDE